MLQTAPAQQNDLGPLPSCIDAERSILGAVLLDNTALGRAAKLLDAGDFSSDAHRAIFQRMVSLSDSGSPIDLVTVVDALDAHAQLENNGGAAYVAALADGMPRVSNVEHYAQIVKEKSLLRKYVHDAQEISSAAMMQGATAEDVQLKAQYLLATGTLQKPALRAVNAGELLALDVPPREFICKPFFTSQSINMLFSKRGAGKTHLGLALAVAIAAGGKFLRFEVPKPRGVLYVDGELPAGVLKEWLAGIVAGADHAQPDPRFLNFITPDLQDGAFPDLSGRTGQSMIEAHLGGVEFLVLDNLSCLCRSGKENEGESWLPIQEWCLRLRQVGISVLLLHHAGKSGLQRGTSRREDLLDTVLALRHPSDYHPDEGLRVEVHVEKGRHIFGQDAKPFEVAMKTNNGAALWTERSVEDGLASRARELFEDDQLSIRDIAEELGMKRSTVARMQKKFKGEKP